MAKVHKIWKKIKSKPYRANIRMDDLDLLLRHAGFEKVSQKGSHRTYKHSDSEDIITIPENKGHPLPAYIKIVYEKIIELEIEI